MCFSVKHLLITSSCVSPWESQNSVAGLVASDKMLNICTTLTDEVKCWIERLLGCGGQA